MGKRDLAGHLLLAAAIAALGLSQGIFAAAERNPTATVYVTNSGGNDVTAVDLKTRKVTGDIVLGRGVHGACAPADGRTIFFTVMSTRTLEIVDTADNRVIGTVPLVAHPFGARPNQCASTPDGPYVAVPMRFYGKSQSKLGDVDVVDVTKRTVVKVLSIRFPHNCAGTASNSEIFCESRATGRIYRLNLRTMSFDEKFAIGRDPRPFAISQGARII